MHTRIHELRNLNSTDRRRAEAAKHVLASHHDTNPDVPNRVSTSTAKFEKLLDSQLARASRRDTGPSFGGGRGGGRGGRHGRKTKFQRRGGGSGSAPAHTAKW